MLILLFQNEVVFLKENGAGFWMERKR